MLISNFKLQGFNIKVSGSLRLPTTDLSGSTSSTEVAENGVKPKRLAVTLGIRFVESSVLSQLIALAEKRDENGNQLVYDIVDNTAEVMNIKQIRFVDSISIREQEQNKAWSVSFTLLEHKSTAEITEAKRHNQAGLPLGDTSTFQQVIKNIEANQ